MTPALGSASAVVEFNLSEAATEALPVKAGPYITRAS